MIGIDDNTPGTEIAQRLPSLRVLGHQTFQTTRPVSESSAPRFASAASELLRWEGKRDLQPRAGDGPMGGIAAASACRVGGGGGEEAIGTEGFRARRRLSVSGSLLSSPHPLNALALWLRDPPVRNSSNRKARLVRRELES